MVIAVARVGLAAAKPFADLFAESRFGGAIASLGGALPFFIGIVSVTAFVFGIAYSFTTVPAMTLLQAVVAMAIFAPGVVAPRTSRPSERILRSEATCETYSRHGVTEQRSG